MQVEVVIFVLTVLLISVKAQEPIVQTADGPVQGRTEFATQGRPYSEFLAIPFGQPPIGQLRFAAPLAANGWTEIFNATHNGPLCAQGTLGEEDCLYLNVYSSQLPNATTNPNLPVMVFFYGGAYTKGGTQTYYYGPEKFMNKDVVYVIPAYRLGPFGFLSTADAHAPGNFGLLDQVLALEWVQKNIAAFGGNPGQVTIQGESAGAASVSYLILSPAATGLFHGAIGESGSAVCPWPLQRYPLEATVTLASAVQCPTADSALMLECLRNKTTNEIALPALGLNMTFAPVIEDPSYGQFITDWPLNILNSGNFNKVPVLTGCNKDEGDITYMGTQDYYAVIDDNFFDVILPDLLYTLFQYDHNLINISYAVKAEYYDKIDVTNDSARIRTSIDMNTDSVFLAPNDLYVRKLAGHGLPVYTYLFAFPGAALHNFSGTPEISHAEELPYLFKMISSHFDENQTAVSDIMVDMWTNFATTFNPTPSGYPVQWAPTSASSVEYLYIYGPSDMEMIFNYRSEQMYFWNNIVADIILA